MATSTSTKPRAAKTAERARPSDPNDSRIGREVPETWDEVGFDDGTTYRCEGGYITARAESAGG